MDDLADEIKKCERLFSEKIIYDTISSKISCLAVYI
jgi:hypothetical protein